MTTTEPDLQPIVARIIAELEQNPEAKVALLRVLLTDEFLQLPVKIERLEEALLQFIAASNVRMTALESTMDVLRSEVGELRTGQEELRAEVKELRAGQEELRAGQEELRAGQAKLRADIEEIRAELKEIRDELSALRRDFNRIHGLFSIFLGYNFELTVSRFLLDFAQVEFDLRSPKYLLSKTAPNDPSFNRAISDAKTSRRATPEEVRDLLYTDFIISDENNCQVVVEASITANNNDINRALSRAAIMQKITGGRCYPAIASSSIAPPQQALADQNGVTVFDIPYAPPE